MPTCWHTLPYAFSSQLRAIGPEAHVQQKPEQIVNPVPASVSAMTMAFERQEALYNRMNPQTNRPKP
jgi:hypothetical protein